MSDATVTPVTSAAAALRPRVIALRLLQTILLRRRPLDELLEADRSLAELSGRDRAFARLIVTTCLRRLGQLDDLVDRCLSTPLPRRAEPVRDVLRLGIAQLLFIGTPPHAAVDSAVELCGEAGYAGFKGLVNAVLRRLSRDGASIVAEQDVSRLTTRDWLWDSWIAHYGEATARAIADAHLLEPPLDLSPREDAELWAQRLEGTVIATGTIRRPGGGGSVADFPGFSTGAWWVQDAAASLPARLFGDVADRRVVDLCAAPGGKTAQLAAAGARVTAVDRAPKRMQRLRENLDRIGVTAETVIADAGEWRPDGPVDAVLLDAPCSATGTIRRHPDVPFLKSPQDLPVLGRVQDRLMDSAARMVGPGGMLVYCVCSLQPEEGLERVAAFLERNAAFRRIPISAGDVCGIAESVTPEGDLRTLPSHLAEAGGLDGFFAARLARSA